MFCHSVHGFSLVFLSNLCKFLALLCRLIVNKVLVHRPYFKGRGFIYQSIIKVLDFVFLTQYHSNVSFYIKTLLWKLDIPNLTFSIFNFARPPLFDTILISIQDPVVEFLLLLVAWLYMLGFCENRFALVELCRLVDWWVMQEVAYQWGCVE